MSAKKTINRIGDLIDTNPIEAVTHLGSGITDSFINDLVKGGTSDAWKQMLGAANPFEHKSSQQHGGGDLHEGQEINLSNGAQKNHAEKTEKPKNHHIEAGMDYHREILHGEARIAHEQSREIEAQIQEIVMELKRLTATSKILAAEFREVTVEQHIDKPGKYHVNFFDWVLTVVRSARMRVEDSGAWLSSMKGKKNKNGYWEQFDQKGTSFGLSNERAVATQTG